MKTKLFWTVVLMISAVGANYGQTTSVSVSNSKSSSVTVDGDGNVSVSVKENDDYYKFRAKFKSSKTDKIRKILRDNLGPDFKSSGNEYTWVTTKNEEETGEFTVKRGEVRIYLDKQMLSTGDFENLKEVADEIKKELNIGINPNPIVNGSHYIGVHRNVNHGRYSVSRAEAAVKRAIAAVKRAENQLERAEYELEKAKKDYEFAKKQEDN